MRDEILQRTGPDGSKVVVGCGSGYKAVNEINGSHGSGVDLLVEVVVRRVGG